MGASRDIAEIKMLADSGELRLVYVLGVPRSNSTVVCRLIGERLDGIVYEPAMPSSASPLRHYARLIRQAYDVAKAKTGDRGVVLAVKDLDGFVTDEMFDFILAAAEHIVFTIRDPAAQHPSLSRQFVEEFSLLYRIRSTLRHPIEQNFFLWHMTNWMPRFWQMAHEELGSGQQPLRAAVAGFNYASWRAQARHIESARRVLGEEGVTILDAGLSRLFPQETGEELAGIARSAGGGGAGSATEIAGHSRMERDSHWAGEARAGGKLKPLGGSDGTPFSDPDANEFARRVSATLYPQYLESFYDPLHRQLRSAREAGLPDRSPHSLRQLVEAGNSAEAGRRLKATAI